MGKNNRTDHKTIAVVFVIIAVCVAVVAFLLFVLNGRETRNSDGDTNILIGVLTCDSSSPTDVFFKGSGEVSPNHKVKVTFRGGKYDIFDYTYSARYDGSDRVQSALSTLKAKYNKYMVSVGMHQDNLSPTFSNMGSELIINLYIERKNLTQGTGKLVFLNEQNFVDIDRYSVEDFKRMYSSKGFACQYTE